MKRIPAQGAAALALAALSLTATAGGLPEDVEQAVAARDCPRLIELNKRYWLLAPDATRAQAVAALEQAILELPDCGRVSAELVRLQPVSGPNPLFFRQSQGGNSKRR